MHLFCPLLVIRQTRLQEREIRRLDFLGWHLVESTEVGDRKCFRCGVGGAV